MPMLLRVVILKQLSECLQRRRSAKGILWIALIKAKVHLTVKLRLIRGITKMRKSVKKLMTRVILKVIGH